ncbi:hypothetical protein LZ30DRAFT_739170 [Colletotrichum cereale]|nr:hypothetical protein LZ30DRAFT_739170 [Colletotrichum cereale]
MISREWLLEPLGVRSRDHVNTGGGTLGCLNAGSGSNMKWGNGQDTSNLNSGLNLCGRGKTKTQFDFGSGGNFSNRDNRINVRSREWGCWSSFSCAKHPLYSRLWVHLGRGWQKSRRRRGDIRVTLFYGLTYGNRPAKIYSTGTSGLKQH